LSSSLGFCVVTQSYCKTHHVHQYLIGNAYVPNVPFSNPIISCSLKPNVFQVFKSQGATILEFHVETLLEKEDKGSFTMFKLNSNVLLTWTFRVLIHYFKKIINVFGVHLLNYFHYCVNGIFLSWKCNHFGESLDICAIKRCNFFCKIFFLGTPYVYLNWYYVMEHPTTIHNSQDIPRGKLSVKILHYMHRTRYC